MVGVQGHRVVERGHEIGPPSQLGVDVAPGGGRAVARAGQAVVEQDGQATTSADDRGSDPDQHAARLPAQAVRIDARLLARQGGR